MLTVITNDNIVALETSRYVAGKNPYIDLCSFSTAIVIGKDVVDDPQPGGMILRRPA